MPAYGKVKVDTITYDLSGTATDVSVADIATKASPTFTGTINAANLVLSGDLTVNGTTTTIDTTTLQVEDKNIEIGKVSSPSDTTADGGGWTLKGATDKTFNWVNATDAWTTSEHIHLGDNKKLLIGTGSDLYLQHNGQDSNIINSTGDLYIQNTGDDINIRAQDDINLQVQNGETAINCIGDGAVELYHDNFKCFETYDRGITVYGPEGNNGEVYIYADEGDDNADKWRLQANTGGTFNIGNYSTGSWVNGLTLDGSNNATFAGTITTAASSGALSIPANGDIRIANGTWSGEAAGKIQHNSNFLYIQGGTSGIKFRSSSGTNTLEADSSGNATFAGTVSDSKGDLRKIIQNTQGSAYTLVAADAGKHILASGNITIPNSIFSAGDGVVIVNNTSGDLTITSGITNLYLGTDGSTGNKTLASRCTCTVLFTSGTAGYISGGGLS